MVLEYETMIFAIIYLITLFIAPQLWLKPFIGIRVDLFIYPVWFFYLLLSGKFKNFRFGPQEKFFIFWIAWIIISLMANGVLIERWENIVFFYIKWFILYLFISLTLRSVRNIQVFSVVLVILAIILCIEGIDQYQKGIGWAGQALGWVDDAASKGRTKWINIFDGPGVFCVVYTIALPFILPLFTKAAPFIRKIFFIFLFGLFVTAIYVNGSRGGLLTALAIILMYYGQEYIKKNKLLFIILIAGILGALTLLPSYMTQVSDEHHSSAHRVEMWAEGCEMIKQNPIFGIGRGGFASYTGKLVAHNSFVEIMGETGLPGLFAWMALIYISLKQLYCYFKEGSNKIENKMGVTLSRCLFIAIMGYLISAMFVTLEYETLYILLGVCAAFGRLLKSPIEITAKDLRLIAIIEISWVVFINAFTILTGPGAFS
jgi:hypothetical protein